MGLYTGYLFADPSVWEGIGRLVDIGGTMIEYNYAPISHEAANAIALNVDALALAEDARKALASMLDEYADRLDAAVSS